MRINHRHDYETLPDPLLPIRDFRDAHTRLTVESLVLVFQEPPSQGQKAAVKSSSDACSVAFKHLKPLVDSAAEHNNTTALSLAGGVIVEAGNELAAITQ